MYSFKADTKIISVMMSNLERSHGPLLLLLCILQAWK